MPGVSIQGIQGIAGTLSDTVRIQPTAKPKTRWETPEFHCSRDLRKVRLPFCQQHVQ